MTFSAPLLPLSYHQLRGGKGFPVVTPTKSHTAHAIPPTKGAARLRIDRQSMVHHHREKKAGVAECLRHSATPAYPSMDPPARPGCPLASHPTTSLKALF